MQRITGKEVAMRDGATLRELKIEVCDCHEKCESLRRDVADAQESALNYARQAGELLNKMKLIVGHGNWVEYIKTNLKSVSERSVQLYMKIDNDNPRLRGQPNPQRVADFKFDTVRKYSITHVPDKPQVEHEGNVKFQRSASFLNIVNEFERVVQRHIDGLQLIDWNEVRDETSKLFHTLKWVHGEAAVPPFHI